MLRVRTRSPARASLGLRSSLAIVVALVAVSSDPPTRARAASSDRTSAYSPAYAAIVVDANSGSGDARRQCRTRCATRPRSPRS